MSAAQPTTAEPNVEATDSLPLERAFSLMATAKALTELYEANFKTTSRYVHATSRGHEAIQLAVGMQLRPQDYAYPYYRDDAMLLGLGVTPEELMLQLLGRATDPFSAGRTYYSHPSLRREGLPKIPHQSSATGMQAIPAAGAALGLKYLQSTAAPQAQRRGPSAAGLAPQTNALVVCSLGDASVTEGEVAEAFQMAVLKRLPILFLVQNNEWDISAHASEVRAMDAVEYARGFRGLSAKQIDGTDFATCHRAVAEIFADLRAGGGPWLLQADVPLLNHHTSGVRSDFYRQAELEAERHRDPFDRLRQDLLDAGFDESRLQSLISESEATVAEQYARALEAPEPTAETLHDHIYAEEGHFPCFAKTLRSERGERLPAGAETVNMVDAALHTVGEILEEFPEALLYGQDVGARLGGVFREAALLGRRFGDERVFNTPIQEAFIIGSTAGMSAVGCRAIVEVQFADYIWPGLNQLFTELSRSCYLSAGQWPVASLIRVPIGAYRHGGPYHSSSVESVLTAIRGIKIAYPSNAADMKGLMRAGFEDPNPVVILEHKGLYWSKLPGTKAAMMPEPERGYAIPFGVARTVLAPDPEQAAAGSASAKTSLGIVTYGMGVYWSLDAAEGFADRIEVLDLRTLVPLDEAAIVELARCHHRILIVTEEPVAHSFAQALAGRIQALCFRDLDAPVQVIGGAETPAIPLNWPQEQAYLPNAEKVAAAMEELLQY